jgi:hypothetical protein
MSFDVAPSKVEAIGTDADHKSIDEIIPPVSKLDKRKIIFNYCPEKKNNRTLSKV